MAEIGIVLCDGTLSEVIRQIGAGWMARAGKSGSRIQIGCLLNRGGRIRKGLGHHWDSPSYPAVANSRVPGDAAECDLPLPARIASLGRHVASNHFLKYGLNDQR